ncbi:MAG: DNA cytosine methyltransferase [Nocardioides sp.]
MTEHRTRPTVIDLYAGAGGLSLGMEQAGFDVLVAAELDPVHALVHRYNFPRCEIVCDDLSMVTGRQLLSRAARGWALHHPGSRFLGTVDAVVGGPPCQGFSVGGIRDPNDARNDQLLHFVRLVTEIRPSVFCLENVAGLLESTFDDVRGAALSLLEEAGYSLSGAESWVDAQDFGVPQTRRRVLVLGALGDQGPPQLRPSSSSPKVADALMGLPDPALYRALLDNDEAAWAEGERPVRVAEIGRYAATLAGLRRDRDDYSHPRSWAPGLITGSRRTAHHERTVQRFARTSQGAVEKSSRLYRLDPGAVAHTLRAGTGSDRGSHTSPRPIHPVKNRVVTVREAARLHGYPDWFRFHTTNWHGHRQIGNSVPPPLGRAAGEALLAALVRAPVAPGDRVALGDPKWLRMPMREARDALAGCMSSA